MEKIKEFYEKIKNIKYGWHDKNGLLHETLTEGNFRKDFKMQRISDIMKTNHAVCWEMCEIERSFFKENNLEYKTIFALLSKNKKFPCHTFACFKLNDKWYWFEASWEKEKGIHEYDSLDDIFEFFRNNFEDFTHCKYDPKDMVFFEYKKPLIKRITCNPFYYHCMHSKKIG